MHTNVETNYVDVAFHFKPLGGNVAPARTVDAVLDVVPGTEDVPARNDLDIKSYAVIVDKDVAGGSDPDAPASMLPQAALRLAPFQLLNLTTLPLAGASVATLDGDLVAADRHAGSGRRSTRPSGCSCRIRGWASSSSPSRGSRPCGPICAASSGASWPAAS